MPSYKLTYFNSRGLGECIRYMLKLKEQDFEDVRFKRGDDGLEQAKAKSPFKQLPILEVEGLDLIICQSRVIERYLAKKLGLLGKSERDAIKCEIVAACIDDVKTAIMKVFFGTKEEDRPAAIKELAESTLPPILEKIQSLMDGDYFVGNEVTYADLAVFHIFEFMDMLGELNPLKNFAKLTKNNKLIASIPQIENWMKTRPKDDY